MSILIAGWFSFEDMGATAGDLLSRDLVCEWLTQAGLEYQIAVAPPFEDGVDWQTIDVNSLDALIFICGPFGNGPPLTDFLPRFAGRPFIGMNLTMLQNLSEWNPFDLLLERDSSENARPDLVFLTSRTPVPVAGLVLVDPQPEYGKRGLHELANEAFRELVDQNELAVVHIDTRLDSNRYGLRTPAEVESLIARMDVVLTTRLHGMVMALKNGVPVLAIDPIEGGAKILRQANAIGWETVFTGDDISDTNLQKSLDYCLSPAGKENAREISKKAVDSLSEIRNEFLKDLSALMS